MSYQETKTGASILSGITVLAAYCMHAFNPARLAALPPDDLKPWAVTMLTFIAIGIGVSIAIQILFHILFSVSVAVRSKIENQAVDDQAIGRTINREMVEDERDRLIERKSMFIGVVVAGAGFIAGLFALVLNQSPVVMLNILFITFSAGSILEGVLQLYYYRRGG